MNAVYVIDIVRTPVGKFGGALASVRPDDLAATVIKALIERNPSIDLTQVDEVILGAANQGLHRKQTLCIWITKHDEWLYGY